MKKFQFSLSKVLDYKDQVLEKEKNHLANLHAKKARIDQCINDFQVEFEAVNQRFMKETAQGISVIQIKTFEFQLQSIRLQIKQLQSEQKALSQTIEKQIQVVIEASQEVTGLDKLEEKQRMEYNIEQAKGNEAQIAEFVSSRLIRQRIAETSF